MSDDIKTTLADRVRELATEVQELEERDLIRMADVVAQVEVEEGAYIFWRCPEEGCHKQVLCLWEDGEEPMGRLRYQQFCDHEFDQPEHITVDPAKLIEADLHGDEERK